MKIRYERLFIAVLIGSFIISGILYLSTSLVIDILVDHTEKTDLKGHTDTLVVEGYKYTSDTQTNVQDTQKQENRLCGLAVVGCKNEKQVERTDLDIIKELSAKYEVDWKLIESIVIHETGNRTSRAYKELNNAGGLMMWSNEQNTMILRQFNTVEESYEFMIKNIKNNYLDLGLTTIEEIGNKYCPISINDKGQNQYWIPQVKAIYESLEV